MSLHLCTRFGSTWPLALIASSKVITSAAERGEGFYLPNLHYLDSQTLRVLVVTQQATASLSLMRQIYLFFLLSIFSLGLISCGQEAGPPPPPTPTLSPEAQQGKNLFTRECASCHSLIENTVIVGPSLHGIAGRAKERVADQDAHTYLLTSILSPNGYLVEGYQDLMPATFGKTLTGEEIDAIVAYLLTLE